jgi:ssDNA-binding Zn-finger/Zn-ribbon topoisomerase 1
LSGFFSFIYYPTCLFGLYLPNGRIAVQSFQGSISYLGLGAIVEKGIAMELTYKCPRCNGTDTYLAKRQVIKGKGVFLRAKMVDTPTCRQCGETANVEQVNAPTSLSEALTRKKPKTENL